MRSYPRVCIRLGLCAWLIAACALPGQTQEERIRLLESELRLSKERAQAQDERIRELELSLLTVLEEPPGHDSRAANDSQQLEQLVEEMVQAEVSALHTARPRDDSLRLYGQARFVARAFSGAEITTDQSFELEHMIVSIDLQVEEAFHLVFSPGVSHRGGVFILEAYGEYTLADWLKIRGGRFIIPFNGIHAWAFPSDSFIEPFLSENSPRPFLYAPWWDEGLMASGSVKFGDEKQHRLTYSGYVLNGFDASGLNGFHKTNIGDNNESKTLGARLASSFRLGEDSSLTVGAGILSGKYDSNDDLAFYAIVGDLEFATGNFSLYAELMYRPQEFRAGVQENPAAVIQDVSRLLSLKLRPQYRLTEAISLYAQIDYLRVRQPERTAGEVSVFALEDEEFAVLTALLGIRYDINAHLKLSLEFGIFERDKDLGDDIRFVALSLFYSF